jgi:hypothetical protein
MAVMPGPQPGAVKSMVLIAKQPIRALPRNPGHRLGAGQVLAPILRLQHLEVSSICPA